MDKYLELIRGAVRPFVTIVLTILVWIMALRSQITPEQILVVYATIIGFWFGTRSNASSNGGSP